MIHGVHTVSWARRYRRHCQSGTLIGQMAILRWWTAPTHVTPAVQQRRNKQISVEKTTKTTTTTTTTQLFLGVVLFSQEGLIYIHTLLYRNSYLFVIPESL